jgi:hypothetical protein
MEIWSGISEPDWRSLHNTGSAKSKIERMLNTHRDTVRKILETDEARVELGIGCKLFVSHLQG